MCQSWKPLLIIIVIAVIHVVLLFIIFKAERLQDRYQQDLAKNEDIMQNFGLELQDFINIISAADADEILTNQTVLDINLLVLPAEYGASLKVNI